MNKYILVLNAGSATLKFRLFDSLDPAKQVMAGICEKIGWPRSFLSMNNQRGLLVTARNHTDALKLFLEKMGEKRKQITLIGHRVVHGGEKFTGPILVDRKVAREIDKFSALAPLHNPINLQVIKACWRWLPQVKNIAVFDTAFFAKLKPENYLYALPLELYRRFGVRRYGFHGIAHEYMANQAAIKLKKSLSQLNLITLHLGNGCSATAIRQGKPLVTSMGFTPLAGLVMGTRSGDLDPALPFYLQKKLRLSSGGVSNLLNNQSGLLGLSGFSSDMREILKAAGHKVIDYHGRRKFSQSQKCRARLALAVYLNRVQEYLWYYAGLLGRVDAIVFSGGTGERSPIIRQLALQGLINVRKARSLVVPANEELAIAQQIDKFI